MQAIKRALVKRRKERKLSLMAVFLNFYYILSFVPFLIINLVLYSCQCDISDYGRYDSAFILVIPEMCCTNVILLAGIVQESYTSQTQL